MLNKNILAFALIATSLTSHANTLTKFKAVQNTDFLQFGLGGVRGVGAGEISVSGVSGIISGVYLYWHGPTATFDSTANSAILFNGNEVVGSNIGFSNNNFWSYANSQAYRADVTQYFSSDGIYMLANLEKSNSEVNGASLIAFFNDGVATNNVDVIVYDGNDSNYSSAYDNAGWEATVGGFKYGGGPARVSLHVSDGQDFGLYSDGTLYLNSHTADTDNIFQGNTTPFSSGGVANGKLWDIRSFDIGAGNVLAQGASELVVELTPGYDAMSLIVAAVELPIGSISAVPEQTTFGLMLLGLASLRIRAGRLMPRQRQTTEA
jgi:hypothetical protein